MYIGVCSQCCRPIHNDESFKLVTLGNGLGENRRQTYVYQHRDPCVVWPTPANQEPPPM